MVLAIVEPRSEAVGVQQVQQLPAQLRGRSSLREAGQGW